MLKLQTEKRLLQTIIILACIVPVSAGLAGMLGGAAFFGGGNIDLDSHTRYLSGLLLGIGLGFLSAVPKIEMHRPRIGLLTSIVVIGGFGRLLGLFLIGTPSITMQLALVMELVITPLICYWQNHFSKRFTKAKLS